MGRATRSAPPMPVPDPAPLSGGAARATLGKLGAPGPRLKHQLLGGQGDPEIEEEGAVADAGDRIDQRVTPETDHPEAHRPPAPLAEDRLA